MHNRIKLLSFLCLVISLACLSINCSKKPVQNDILGYWKGRYNGRDFYIHFRDSQNFAMSIVNKRTSGRYRADFSKNPIQLAIVNQFGVKENIIAEFIDKEHLRFQTGGPDKPFPEQFDPAKAFILRKVADENE